MKVVDESFGTLQALETCCVISNTDRLFNDLYKIHVCEGGDHPKGNTFFKRVSDRHGRSITREICKLFTDTCALCLKHMKKTKPTAGHQPILTRGLGARGQVDLIDFQAYPDGVFKHLLVYVDHGIKMCWLTPIVAKRASTVAFALFQIFVLWDPPQFCKQITAENFPVPQTQELTY